MPAFIVATVDIIDPARFAEYAKEIVGLSERHGGEPMLRGSVSEVLEGDTPAGQRVVVTRFHDADAARGYIRSAEYQAAAVRRIGAATVVMRLVEV